MEYNVILDQEYYQKFFLEYTNFVNRVIKVSTKVGELRDLIDGKWSFEKIYDISYLSGSIAVQYERYWDHLNTDIENFTIPFSYLWREDYVEVETQAIEEERKRKNEIEEFRRAKDHQETIVKQKQKDWAEYQRLHFIFAEDKRFDK